MPSTRTHANVIARDSGTDRFIRVEISTRGDGKNTQKQCASGELEFDSTKKRFIFVAKDKRKPFTETSVTTSDSIPLRDRK